jgi:hypothetical protein
MGHAVMLPRLRPPRVLNPSKDVVSSGIPLSGDTVGVTDAAERLRRRYPGPRVPRTVKVALIGLGVVIAMSWLIWAALVHSRPAVAAQVAAYAVTSDTTMSVTISVDRRDPSVPVTCRLIAQAEDFQPVAEQQVPIEASTARVVDKRIVLTTMRRATSASVKVCVVD